MRISAKPEYHESGSWFNFMSNVNIPTSSDTLSPSLRPFSWPFGLGFFRVNTFNAAPVLQVICYCVCRIIINEIISLRSPVTPWPNWVPVTGDPHGQFDCRSPVTSATSRPSLVPVTGDPHGQVECRSPVTPMAFNLLNGMARDWYDHTRDRSTDKVRTHTGAITWEQSRTLREFAANNWLHSASIVDVIDRYHRRLKLLSWIRSGVGESLSVKTAWVIWMGPIASRQIHYQWNAQYATSNCKLFAIQVSNNSSNRSTPNH